MNNTTNNTNVRIVQVNTTAWEEEDMLLVTNLTDEQIQSVANPIVERERESDDYAYVNEDLAEALRRQFPDNIIINYDPSDIDFLNI